MGLENVGIHLVGNEFDVARLLGPQGQKPRIVKLVNSAYDMKVRVRQVVGQDCLIVVRFQEDSQPLSAPATDARNWYLRHVSQMLAMTDPNVAFEGYNEIADGNARAYCVFETTRLGLMHAAGFDSVVGNFSLGTPDYPTWAYYRPILDAMGPRDRVGLHEYFGDAEDIDKNWYCGRWVNVPELAGKQIVVTECGQDGVEGAPAGWKLTGWSAEYYVSLLEKYAQVCGDIPAVVYTGGLILPPRTSTEVDNRNFDVNDIWPLITAQYTATAPPTPIPVPAPATAPVPDIFYLLLGPRAAECHTSRTSADHLAAGKHIAYDVAGMKHWPVYAVADGWVDFVIYEDANTTKGRGHALGVVHPSIRVGPHDCLEVSPCHLADVPLVKEGERVRRGQLLGYTGWSGKVDPPNEHGEHVHLVCYSVKDNALASPWVYIRPESLRVQITGG